MESSGKEKLKPNPIKSCMEDHDTLISVENHSFWRSTRIQISLLLAFAMLDMGLTRFNLSMAMVCMVNNTAFLSKFTPANVSVFSADDNCQQNSIEIQADYDGTFAWTSTDVGLVFSAIWWGALITTIPAGCMADRYGPKRIIIVCSIMNFIGSLLSPTVSRWGYEYLFALRLIQGLGMGFILPCVAAMIARWIPPHERSTAIAVYTLGNQLCLVVGNPLFAFLCREKWILGGWPSIFYFCASLSIVFLLTWTFLVNNRPERTPRVSRKELSYIQLNLKDENLRSRKNLQVPWRPMLKSKVVWACICSNFAAGLCAFTLASYIPTYFKNVLVLDLKKNGLLSSLPFISQFLFKSIFSLAADSLKRRKIFKPTNVCKIFNTVALFGQGIILIATSYLDCNHAGLAIASLCLATGVGSGAIPGFLTASMSIAPQFTGTVRSLCALFSSLAGITSPYMVGLLSKNGTRAEWQRVFIVFAGISFVAGLIFLICGEAEVQDWAKQSHNLKKFEIAALDPQQAGTVALLTTGPQPDLIPVDRVEFLTGDSQNRDKDQLDDEKCVIKV